MYLFISYLFSLSQCCRNKEQEEWKREMRKFEERMEALRGDLKKERDKSQRKNLKDIGEVNIHNSDKILYTVKFSKCIFDVKVETFITFS